MFKLFTEDQLIFFFILLLFLARGFTRQQYRYLEFDNQQENKKNKSKNKNHRFKLKEKNHMRKYWFEF